MNAPSDLRPRGSIERYALAFQHGHCLIDIVTLARPAPLALGRCRGGGKSGWLANPDIDVLAPVAAERRSRQVRVFGVEHEGRQLDRIVSRAISDPKPQRIELARPQPIAERYKLDMASQSQIEQRRDLSMYNRKRRRGICGNCCYIPLIIRLTTAHRLSGLPSKLY